MKLVVRREWILSPEMELLRARVLGYERGQTGDAFDARSSHVVAYVDGEPVGMVRETPARPSLLARWARGCWSLPTGSDVVELNRGVVGDAWRRRGVYRLLMLEVMASLPTESVKTATAAVEPDFVGRRFLEGLGFGTAGPRLLFRDEPRERTLVVPILTAVDAEQQRRWQTMRAAWKEMLARADVLVVGSADRRSAPPPALRMWAPEGSAAEGGTPARERDGLQTPDSAD